VADGGGVRVAVGVALAAVRVAPTVALAVAVGGTDAVAVGDGAARYSTMLPSSPTATAQSRAGAKRP
jgi:hypothetical protein